MISREAFGQLAEAILEAGAKRATKYVSKTEVVKATRRGKRRKHDRRVEILFTAGAPNYAERAFIKRAARAGETFPMRVVAKYEPRTK